MMLSRVLEPEVMDTPEEAVDYDAMDHRDVNRVFVDDFLHTLNTETKLGGRLRVLDAGTGTARIPIELVSRYKTCPFSIVAVDFADAMLKVAERNVSKACFSQSIELAREDCKALSFAEGSFDAVMSNSIVHHIPEPAAVFAEMWRVLKPGGFLFVRDLLRPPEIATLDSLVEQYAGEEAEHARQMFRDSLHAALTIEELQATLSALDIPAESVRQTTDRHWTLGAIR